MSHVSNDDLQWATNVTSEDRDNRKSYTYLCSTCFPAHTLMFSLVPLISLAFFMHGFIVMRNHCINEDELTCPPLPSWVIALYIHYFLLGLSVQDLWVSRPRPFTKLCEWYICRFLAEEMDYNSPESILGWGGKQDRHIVNEPLFRAWLLHFTVPLVILWKVFVDTSKLIRIKFLFTAH